MATALEREATTKRWRRVEYERLVDLGLFVGERRELLDGVLVLKEPQGSASAAMSGIVGEVLATAFSDAAAHTRIHVAACSPDGERRRPPARGSPPPDFRQIRGEDDQDVCNTPGVLNAVVVGKGLQTSVGVFGELSINPLPGLQLLGNLRFDYFLNSDGQIVTHGVTQRFSSNTLDV